MVKTLAIKLRAFAQPESYSPLLSFSKRWLSRSITSRWRFFSFYLSTGDESDYLPQKSSKPSPALPLRRHNLGFSGRFQLENRIWNLLIQLDIGVFGEAVIAGRFEELLLD